MNSIIIVLHVCKTFLTFIMLEATEADVKHFLSSTWKQSLTFQAFDGKKTKKKLKVSSARTESQHG